MPTPNIFFFYFGLTAHQDYFTHFEPSQSLGGAKMGDPQEKLPDHLQAEFCLSFMWPDLGSNPQCWDEKWFTALKISSLNYSAMGAASTNMDLIRTLPKEEFLITVKSTSHFSTTVKSTSHSSTTVKSTSHSRKKVLWLYMIGALLTILVSHLKHE